MIGHIRIGVVRASRQINGSRGCAGDTLCGSAITDRDLTLAEFRQAERKGLVAGDVCAACRDLARDLVIAARGVDRRRAVHGRLALFFPGDRRRGEEAV